MKYCIAFCFPFLFISFSYSQEFVLYSGLQNNLYFDFLDGNYYDSKSSLSSFVGLQYQHQNETNSNKILLGLNYQKYGSYEKHIIGGLSGTTETTNFNKSVLKFDVQPIGFHFEQHTFLNLGLGMEYLLSEVFSTSMRSWSMNTGTYVTSNPYTEANSTYSHQIVPLITGTLGTKFPLGKQFKGIFQYQFSLGITPELKYGRAFKSFLILGISKSLAEK